MVTNSLTPKEISDIKQSAMEVVQTYGKRDTDLFSRYKEMYFMEDETRRPTTANVDERDWAITVSPTSRNEVTGMVRLLDTSEVGIKVTASDGTPATNANKIEAALKSILRISGERLRARIESDCALSAVLFGPVVMYYEILDDLIASNKEPYFRRQLAEYRKRTPALLRVVNPMESYPEFGDFGMISHTWKRYIKGSVLKERWGQLDARPATNYTVYDYYDCENRVVWADGVKDVIFAGPHMLERLPIAVRYGGGTSLFSDPEKQLNSFLYSKAKSRLDKRENALLTAIATAVNISGLGGPLLSIDPENAPDKITVDYQGHVRFIMAKAQQINDKIIDPVLIEWKRILDELSGQSTIHGQTLGQNIDAGTFSGLAMLSSAGKLPLIDPQRGIEMAFRDTFLSVLNRIRVDGIENSLIVATDIPEDVDITVTLNPKLPQDQLRNAQVAQSLGDLVSDEFKHELMQVDDSEAMRRKVTKETVFKAMLAMIVQDPQRMAPFIQAAMGAMGQQQPVSVQASEPTSPEQQPQPTPEEMAMMQQQGQQPGGPPMPMEQTGMTEPMIPPAERS